jgi:hypothetical protein
MTDPQIAEIARKLTAAQRRAFVKLTREWRFLALSDRPDTHFPVIERCNVPCRGFRFRLTPLGQSVAAYLKEQSNG